MLDTQSNFYFVLVRPVFLGNIGSVARALKNFGFENLRLVEPPRNYKDAEARRMSVGAFDVLREAELFASVDEALKDIALAIGTTSAQQRALQPTSIQEISPRLCGASANSKVAILFGDERNGLLKAELERCHSTVSIPTNPNFPALNIAQAVGVIAYELTRTSTAACTQPEPLSPGANDDEIVAQLDQLLDTIGFTKKFNKENILSEIRSFYQRAYPTEREADLLKGALRKMIEKTSGSSEAKTNPL